MANRLKGEAELKIGDKTYILCFNHNALIELEDQLGLGIVAIASEIQNWHNDPTRMRLKWIRALLYAGLRKYQPKMSLDDVSDIMGEAGQAGVVMGAIGDAMGAAFGGDQQTTTGDVRPTSEVKPNGTGDSSSSSMSPTAMTSAVSGSSPPQNLS